MDESRFDQFAKSFGLPTSRRSAFGILTALWLAGGAATRIPMGVEAKKKRKNKNKNKTQKLKRNSFGCVNAGNACRGNSANCCSGNCEGTKPKKGKRDASHCVAHDEVDCPAEADECRPGGERSCDLGGHCYRTTGQASFCGGIFTCIACQKDVDCDAQGFGPGAACIVCAVSCPQTGTACVNVPN